MAMITSLRSPTFGALLVCLIAVPVWADNQLQPLASGLQGTRSMTLSLTSEAGRPVSSASSTHFLDRSPGPRWTARSSSGRYGAAAAKLRRSRPKVRRTAQSHDPVSVQPPDSPVEYQFRQSSLGTEPARLRGVQRRTWRVYRSGIFPGQVDIGAS